MSFTDAFTTVPTADALSSEGSMSNEDELDLLLSSAIVTGSSTSYKTQGRLFTWKSPEWITAQKFVDLKIYNNPNERWKKAEFLKHLDLYPHPMTYAMLIKKFILE